MAGVLKNDVNLLIEMLAQIALQRRNGLASQAGGNRLRFLGMTC